MGYCSTSVRLLLYFAYLFKISQQVLTRVFLDLCALVLFLLLPTLQEIAYKEKRAGDARDSWYIREGFENLLEEGLGKHYPPGEALQADADAKDRAKASFCFRFVAVFSLLCCFALLCFALLGLAWLGLAWLGLAWLGLAWLCLLVLPRVRLTLCTAKLFDLASCPLPLNPPHPHPHPHCPPPPAAHVSTLPVSLFVMHYASRFVAYRLSHFVVYRVYRFLAYCVLRFCGVLLWLSCFFQPRKKEGREEGGKEGDAGKTGTGSSSSSKKRRPHADGERQGGVTVRSRKCPAGNTLGGLVELDWVGLGWVAVEVGCWLLLLLLLSPPLRNCCATQRLCATRKIIVSPHLLDHWAVQSVFNFAAYT